jgi:prepilin-type N-terminal cleavage/methylation domain-containing protein
VTRVRSDQGMTLIELLIALTVMAIAIFAIVAGFSSSILAVQRGGKASVAGALADQKVQTYRQGTFASIPVGVQTPVLTSGTDGRTYYVSTTVSWACVIGVSNGATPPTCTGTPASRPVKLVTVDVHDSTATGAVVASQSSTFDSSTS